MNDKEKDCISNSYDIDRRASNWWWLCSPGKYNEHANSNNRAASVVQHGVINVDGWYVYDPGGVRPALWLSI
jgi:hypothetical protein